MTRRLVEAGTIAGAAGASLASAAAAICCVGPLALTLLGVNGMILAAGLKPYRWLLLGASFAMLAAAHWWVRRDTGTVDGVSCSIKAGRWTRGVLWAASGIFAAAVVLQFAAEIFNW
jgi:hypothetical protein